MQVALGSQVAHEGQAPPVWRREERIEKGGEDRGGRREMTSSLVDLKNSNASSSCQKSTPAKFLKLKT